MSALLNLLQLASPALPLGAYNYSEGLETLVERGTISNETQLRDWLATELVEGAIALETAVCLRAYRCLKAGDLAGLAYWNHWLHASRETGELQRQSAQMGGSLLRLLDDLQETDPDLPSLTACREALSASVHLATAYAISVAHWQIAIEDALLGYLHSWATNLVGAGVKLIPLGQTSGQRLLRQLQPTILQTRDRLFALNDDDLVSCSWGLSLASLQHETLYTRLFRS